MPEQICWKAKECPEIIALVMKIVPTPGHTSSYRHQSQKILLPTDTDSGFLNPMILEYSLPSDTIDRALFIPLTNNTVLTLTMQGRAVFLPWTLKPGQIFLPKTLSILSPQRHQHQSLLIPTDTDARVFFLHGYSKPGHHHWVIRPPTLTNTRAFIGH